MATYFPSSLESISRIFGVGSVKLDKYGQTFLSEILIYCRDKDLEERVIPKITPRHGTRTGKPRYEQVGELYNGGRTVDEIAEYFGVKSNTVIQNLYRYLVDGNALEPDGLPPLISLDKVQLNAIFNAFEELGYERLRPIFDRCEGEFGYDDLNLYRLIRRR